MLEKRKYVRLSKSLKIGYKVVDPANGIGASFNEDISGGGIRLPLKERLQPGTILDLEIYLPEVTEPIVATGKVVWLDRRSGAELPFVVGIKFTKIDQFDRGKILRYIREMIERKESPKIKWLD